ncbi:MAG TPA: L,D-transpeptidase/peptidoglycan binding protein [Solirubrobacterales bacterium]|nr:L,D-transpeptidase/peptidoglycan binding protein [Solirubrobacterales bacterium]
MGTKTKIALSAVGVLVVALIGGAYAYDASHRDEIAAGVTIVGVEVGGMTAEEAEAAVRRSLLVPLRQSLEVSYDGESFTMPGDRLKVRADVAGAVEQAVEASQDGGLPGRLVRYVTGGDVDEAISAEVGYSHSAVNRFVRHVAAELDREPQSASVNPSGDGLEIVAAEDGRKVRDVKLTEQLEEAVVDAAAPRTIVASVHTTEPEVSTEEIASEYPSYLTLDRSTFTLRLWKDLKLAETYTVAVGMEGLETPEGLYEIQEKEENPVWHVPESAWAGDLAGQTIPPGPSNPIKARWMAIYEGAGIHGTEETESLGSAASHGCVRMAISDVEELYDEVEVGTPIFIG